jgi:hypothetical protein
MQPYAFLCLLGGALGKNTTCRLCSQSFRLSEDYNPLDMPTPGEEGGPVVVTSQVLLFQMFDVIGNENTLHLKVWLFLSWIDDRVELINGKTSENIDGDFIGHFWTPDVYIYNVKSMVQSNENSEVKGLSLTKKSSGVELFLSKEINGFVVCPMDFSAFPFNTNICKFQVSSFSFTKERLVFKALAEPAPDHGMDKALVGEYSVEVAYLQGNDTYKNGWLNEEDVYSVVGLKITLRNQHMKYIWVYYLPTFMFTLTSWFSFLLPPTSYPARTSLLVTIFLCQVCCSSSFALHLTSTDGILQCGHQRHTQPGWRYQL